MSLILPVDARDLKLVTGRKGWGEIDFFESQMAQMPQVECEVVHRFTPGLYIRECHVPAGTFLTSKIHRTEHPFVITKGDISVWTEEQGVVRYKAPHTGITQPGTRRVLFAHEDTVWTTFHVTPHTDLKLIEEQIIIPHVPGALPEASIRHELENS